MRLGLCGLLLSACVAFWARRGDQTDHVAAHLAVYAVAFAAYLAALRLCRGLSPRGRAAALGLAVAWRLALACAPPLLSDDVHRYVWEGRIQRHGGNPYAWSDRPAAEKWRPLAGPEDPVWSGINHKDYAAVYPPLWQLAAWLVVSVHDSITAMKLFLVVCELGTWSLLGLLLQHRRLPPERLLVLAWSPLALVEIAGSGHNDALGILLLVASLLALELRRPALSALAAALGFQAKLLPGLVAAAWARRYQPWHVAAAAAAAALVAAPYVAAGADLWHSLGKYARFWRFNETLFALLLWGMGDAARAQAVALALLVGLAALLAWRRAEPAAAALVLVGAWILLAANVLPWYALWLVPLLALCDAPAVLLFTGTVQLAYLVYPAWRAGGPWQLSWGVRVLEYGPCLGIALRGLRRSVAGASP
jgi:hypothetical protein